MIRIYNRYNQSSLDGVTDTQPGLDTVIMVIFAPIFALADLVVIAVMSSIRYHRKLKNEKEASERINLND